jgi:hypothetical protein
MMNAIESLKNTTLASALALAVEDTRRTGARFVGLTYTNENGEKSRYRLIMGINLVSLYKSDLRTLKALRPKLDGVKATACDELIDSVTESLTKGIGNNSAYTLKGYYTPITPNGEVKLHVSETGETHLYIRGYVLTKNVLVKGTYPHVNSAPKTLAKKEIEKSLKRGKIRTFKINVNVLEGIRMNGMDIEIVTK